MSTETMRSDPPQGLPLATPFWWLQNRRYFSSCCASSPLCPSCCGCSSCWSTSPGWGPAHPERGGLSAPRGNPLYVAFSAVCFVFALLHSITWLGISGLILRVPLGERDLPPRVVTGANFALWGVATVVIGGALIFLGR